MALAVGDGGCAKTGDPHGEGSSPCSYVSWGGGVGEGGLAAVHNAHRPSRRDAAPRIERIVRADTARPTRVTRQISLITGLRSTVEPLSFFHVLSWTTAFRACETVQSDTSNCCCSYNLSGMVYQHNVYDFCPISRTFFDYTAFMALKSLETFSSKSGRTS